MQSDILFIQQSLTNNLYYLKTIRQFCLQIQLSFYQNEQEAITTAEAFGKKAEELLERSISLANGKILEGLLKGNILVSKYTIPLEQLTEELFDINLNTQLAEETLTLFSGEEFSTDDTLIQEVEEINRLAHIFVTNFLDFCGAIRNSLLRGDIFSYSYPSIFLAFIEEAALYQGDLERQIKRSGVDPIYTLNFEYYFCNSLKQFTTFIRQFTDPRYPEVIEQAERFISQFDSLMQEYRSSNLSPEKQRELNQKALSTVTEYQAFLEGIMTEILTHTIYFIVVPVFFDNIYTETNYFSYLLKGSAFGIDETTEKNTSA